MHHGPHLSFIAALYNEEQELPDLIEHVAGHVDSICFADDGSTDETDTILHDYAQWYGEHNFDFRSISLLHIGLPETVKNEALRLVIDGDSGWVLMLDADERFAEGVLDRVVDWLLTSESINYTHAYFQKLEIIDGRHVRTFQKSHLFRKGAIRFSTGIHEDDQFTGNGIYKEDWIVLHRKTSDKQKQREREYLDTYDRLYEQGKIDEGRLHWLRGLHHYITR